MLKRAMALSGVLRKMWNFNMWDGRKHVGDDIFDEVSVLVWCIMSKKFTSINLYIKYSHSHHWHLSDGWHNPSKITGKSQIPLSSSNPQHLPTSFLSFQTISIASYIGCTRHTNPPPMEGALEGNKSPDLGFDEWVPTTVLGSIPRWNSVGFSSVPVDDLSALKRWHFCWGEARYKGWMILRLGINSN